MEKLGWKIYLKFILPLNENFGEKLTKIFFKKKFKQKKNMQKAQKHNKNKLNKKNCSNFHSLFTNLNQNLKQKHN